MENTAVLFPVDLDAPFSSLTYQVPSSVATHLITGLEPNGSYDVITQTVASDVHITISPVGSFPADSGGVLVIGGIVKPSAHSVYLPILLRNGEFVEKARTPSGTPQPHLQNILFREASN